MSRDKPETCLVLQAVERAKAGDPAGIHFLYARYATEVCDRVGSLVRDRREAETVTRDVFAGLTTEIATYERGEIAFATWILRIAGDAARERLRAKGGRTASRV